MSEKQYVETIDDFFGGSARDIEEFELSESGKTVYLKRLGVGNGTAMAIKAAKGDVDVVATVAASWCDSRGRLILNTPKKLKEFKKRPMTNDVFSMYEQIAEMSGFWDGEEQRDEKKDSS